jgi:putative PEP-CTERM system TPR-repeat lipoprotein
MNSIRTNLLALAHAVFLAVILVSVSGCDLFMSADQRIARAEQKRAAGDERGAIIDLQNALKSAPDNVKGRLLLADLSLQVGDAKAAETELVRAQQSGAKLEETAVLTAETMLALGKEKNLLVELDAGKLPMSNSQQLTYRGLALLAAADLEQSVSTLTAAVSAAPEYARARIGRARAYAQLGRTDDALADLDAILDADRKHANAWLLRGTLLARNGQYNQALQAFRSAQASASGKLTPIEFNTVLAGSTECQLALGDLASAHQSQSELAARAPDAPLTFFLAARIAIAEQKYSEAVLNSQKALAGAPEFLQAKMLLGTALLANGSANQAAVELAEVVHKDPSNVEARKLLAQADLRLQRPDLALQALSPVTSTTQDAQLDALLGWANLQQGDQEQAVSLLERSAASQPNNVGLQLDLARAYLSSGANEKAVTLLRRIPAQAGDARRDTLLLAAVSAASGAY